VRESSMRKFNPLDHPICFSYPLRVVPSSWMEHVPFAMFLIDVLKPRLFVELGTALGVSYCAFCQAVKEQGLNTRCYAVDTWEGDSQTGLYSSDALEALHKHHDPLYGSFSTLIQGTFDDALTHFENGTIDLLHIDGFHTYDAVRNDFENWLPKMSEEGVILFHDINVREGDFGVWQLWEELKQRYVHFDFSHEHGLGLLVVGRQPDALKDFLNLEDSDSTRVRDFFYQLGLRLRHSVARDEDTNSLWTRLVEREREFALERTELERLTYQVADAQRENKELSKQLGKRDKKINQLSVDLADKYRELQDLTTRQMAMAGESLATAARLRAKEKEQDRLNTQRGEQQRLNAELAEQLAEQQRLNAELAEQLTEQQRRLAELAQAREMLQSEFNNLSSELQNLSADAGSKEQLLQSVSLDLAERNSQFNRINSSFGGRLLNSFGKVKYRYLLPVYKLINPAPRGRQNHDQHTDQSVREHQSESADEDKAEGDGDAPASEIRLGIILPEADLPSEEDLKSFFSEFGDKHRFILNSNGSFQVLTATGNLEANYESLPVDYVYQPDNWNQRLTEDHLRNALLCLSNVDLDFVIVSPSLSRLPQIAVSSIRNHLIFSKALGLEFLQNSDKKARGRVLRLLPCDHPVTEIQIEEVFSNSHVTYMPDLGHYTPEDNFVYLNHASQVPTHPSPGNGVPTSFIPPFIKQKPLVFVWPIRMAVGGVERNAIEVMRQLKDRFDFVVINMERLNRVEGSLHHQLKDITVAVYDLLELAPLDYFLAMLRDLKSAYEPDLIWICNGMPWLCDNAKNLREIYRDVPIVDQQVYDTNIGWITHYHEPGIQSFDRFIAVNAPVYNTFIDRLGMKPDTIDLIYPAFDSKRFSGSVARADQSELIKEYDLPTDRPLAVFSGRLIIQKRPLDFLELVRRRLQADDPVFFVMIGEGGLSDEVDAFIKEHQLTNLRRIPFLNNMAPLYSIASGLIMTSGHEGLPIVILEALSMGVPVLATDVGDIRLVLERYHCGLVVPEFGNVDAFEKSYEEWIENLASYTSKARESAPDIRNRFSSETIARQYGDSWDRAMKEFVAH
jgi:glycosyltransferase involved in cell wall biosynthesis